MRSLLRLLIVACFALLTAGPHVVAQNDDSLRNPVRQVGPARNPLEWLFGNRQKAQPTPERTQRSYQPRTRSASAPRPALAPGQVYGPPVPPEMMPQVAPGQVPQVADAVPPAPSVAMTVAVAGDSLAALLAQGLQETYADRPGVTFLKKARDSSGLVRDDYYDWPKALRDLLAGAEKIDVLVFMAGSNDRQQLRDDAGVHDPRSERWRDLYIRRIDDIIAIAREKRVPLIWVGMPVMRTERYSGDMLAFNEIYRARAQQAGIAYVDVWEAFATESGEYSATGPDIGGEIVRLRTSDGVHFTKAGARKLAFFADKELQKIVSAAQDRLVPAARPDPALPAAPGGPSLPAGGDGLAMIPAPPDPVLPPALRTLDSILGIPVPLPPATVPLAPRPVAGPVLPLTGPALAPGGVLVSASRPALPEETARVLISGRAPAAKPGRADDFRYP